MLLILYSCKLSFTWKQKSKLPCQASVATRTKEVMLKLKREEKSSLLTVIGVGCREDHAVHSSDLFHLVGNLVDESSDFFHLEECGGTKASVCPLNASSSPPSSTSKDCMTTHPPKEALHEAISVHRHCDLLLGLWPTLWVHCCFVFKAD